MRQKKTMRLLKLSDNEYIEFTDVLQTVQKLYGDKLNTKQLETMAGFVMELDKLQNKAYEVSNKIAFMVDKPTVIQDIMNDIRENQNDNGFKHD